MVNKQPVLTLSSFSGESRLTGSDNLNFQNCPICGSTKWKVYVNTARGVWMCFAGDHSSGGKLIGPAGSTEQDLFSALASLKDAAPDDESVVVRVDAPATIHPSQYLLDDIESNWHIKSAYVFGVRAWYSDKEDANRIIQRHFIPFYSPDVQLIGYTGRLVYQHLHRDRPKYYNAGQKRVLYNPRNGPGVRAALGEIAYPDTLFIVEGPFDAMRMAEAGYNVVALGGKTLPRSLQNSLLTECQEYGIITILLDLDACNEAFDLYLFLRDKLPPTSAVILGELPGKDPCELSLDRLVDSIEHILKAGLTDA